MVDEYDLPDVDKVDKEKPSLLNRLFPDWKNPLRDESSSSTFRIVVTVAVIGAIGSYVTFKASDSSIKRTDYEDIARKTDFGVAEQGVLTLEREQEINEEEEQKRIKARANGESFTPDRTRLINFIQADQSQPVSQQVTNACEYAYRESLKSGDTNDTILSSVGESAAAMSIEREQPIGAILLATVNCVEAIGLKLQLKPHDIIEKAIAVMTTVAQTQDIKTDRIVTFAGQLSYGLTKSLSLPKKERLFVPGRTVVASAKSLDATVLDNGYYSGVATAQVAKSEGIASPDDQLDNATQTVMYALEMLSTPISDRPYLSAQIIERIARALGLDDEAVMRVTTRAAALVAKSVGLSKEEQLDAIRLAAKYAAQKMEIDGEERVLLAAKYAAQAAKDAGFSASEQVALAAKVASTVATELGVSDEAALTAVIKAASRAAKETDLDINAQIALVADVTAQAAKALGMSEQEQILAAGRAAMLTANERGLSKLDAIKHAAKASAYQAKKQGLSALEQIAYAAKAGAIAAKTMGFSDERVVELAAQIAADTAKQLGLSEEQALNAVKRAILDAVDLLDASEEEKQRLAVSVMTDQAKKMGLTDEQAALAAANLIKDRMMKGGASDEEVIEAVSRAALQAAKQLGMSDDEQLAMVGRAAQQAAKDLGWNADQQNTAVAAMVTKFAKEKGYKSDAIARVVSDSVSQAAKASGMTETQAVNAVQKAVYDAIKDSDLTEAKKREVALVQARKVANQLGWSDAQVRALTTDIDRVSPQNYTVKSHTGTTNNGGQSNTPQTRSTASQREAYTLGQASSALAAIMQKDSDNQQAKAPTSRDTLVSVSTITRFPNKADTSEAGTDADQSTQARPINDTDTNNPITSEPQGLPDVAAGEWLYGIQIININTDTATDVVTAKIVGSVFDGAIVFGAWEKRNEWSSSVALTFDRMVFKKREIPNVELIAYHPSTGLPAFATDINHHYLQRFVGVTFKAIGGGGAAAINAVRNVTERENADGDAVIVSRTALSTKEAKALFGAEALKEVGNFASKWAARPITIHAVNEQMNLLVMNGLRLPK